MAKSRALVPVQATEPGIPCPEGLTQMQHAFCVAYVSNGNGNASQAARQAGYSTASAANVGSSLLHRGEVQTNIRNLTAVLLSSLAPQAAVSMGKLALSAKSELVRQNAARDILDRTGFKPPDKHQHLVSGGITISIDLGG